MSRLLGHLRQLQLLVLVFPIAPDLAMRVAGFSLYQLIFGPYFTFQGQAKDRIVDSAIVLVHHIP